MDNFSALTDENYEKLALKIKDNFFNPVNTYKTTVFLCGADIKQSDKIRAKIAQALNDKKHSYLFDVIYPEDIFDDLLYSSQSKDLLSLENLLADSVDAVVIIPESPGSFTELGAFANNEQLRRKIICVLDKQYKKKKSFINQGPVRLIKDVDKERVLFIDTNDIDAEVYKLRRVLLHLKELSKKSANNLNLLQVDTFLLPAIYLLEPVSRSILSKIVSYATNDSFNSYQMTVTALTALSKKRYVELTGLGYKLTGFGVESFFNLRRPRKRLKIQSETNSLDEIRLDILNLRLRNKKLSV
jgi:hypothetical protein